MELCDECNNSEKFQFYTEKVMRESIFVILHHFVSTLWFHKASNLHNKIARTHRASAIWGLWKMYKCLSIPNCTRKMMWLLINNIHEKILRWLSRRNACVSRNQRKIAPSIVPSRACAWFESKIFDWPSVSFFDHWPIRMLGLLPLFALNWLFSALFSKKDCTLLTNQNGEIFSGILLG